MRDNPSREQSLSKFLADRSSLASLLITSYENGECSPENRPTVAFNVYTNLLYLSICRYSLGHSLEDVERSLEHAIQWYVITSGTETTNVSHESYFKHLTLFSLIRLLDVDEMLAEKAAEKWNEYGVEDALITGIISGSEAEPEVGNRLLFPEIYGDLYKILCSTTDALDSKLLKGYLKNWYSKHRNCHWYNGHKAKGPAYFGYWSFEAAAVIKIKRTYSALSNPGPHFPIETLKASNVAKHTNSQSRSESTLIHYPGLNSLCFNIGQDFKNESKERLNLISMDEKLEISGTVFVSENKNLAEFALAKSESIKVNMPWYKQVADWAINDQVDFKSLQSEYEGVWPNEKDPTYHIVLVIDLKQYMFTVGFTCLTKDLKSYRSTISEFLSHMQFTP